MTEKGISQILNKVLRRYEHLSLDTLATVENHLDPGCSEKIREFRVIFPLYMTLHALAGLPAQHRSSTSRLQSDIFDYLKDVGIQHRYGYWYGAAPKGMMLPADLDDTSYALAAIHRSEGIISPQSILQATLLELKPGGPYRTWFVDVRSKDYQSWVDIDPMVNANFAYLCSLSDIKPHGSREYLLNKLKQGSYDSQYYPHKLIYCYFLARALQSWGDKPGQRQLYAELGKYQFGALTTVEKLYYMLSLGYLARNDEISQTMLSEVTSQLDSHGLLPVLPICLDYKYKGKPTYTGSKYASTTLLVELLGLLTQTPQSDCSANSVRLGREKIDFCEMVELEVRRVLNLREGPSVDGGVFNIEKSKIIHLIYLTASCLVPALPKHQLSALVQWAAAAHIGWQAYTIYDDYYDGQRGMDQLPSAHFLARQSLNLYSASLGKLSVALADVTGLNVSLAQADKYYQSEIERKMSGITEAHPTIADYAYLEDRLSPIIFTLQTVPDILELTNTEKISQGLAKFFLALLCLDQLSDDLKDWEQDLADGHENFITHKIRSAENDGGVTGKKEILRNEVYPTSLKLVQDYSRKAHNALHTLNLEDSDLAQLLKQKLSEFSRLELAQSVVSDLSEKQSAPSVDVFQ